MNNAGVRKWWTFPPLIFEFASCSRFDLILVLFDDHTPTWDSLVAGYLLKEQAVIEENNILKNYTGIYIRD